MPNAFGTAKLWKYVPPKAEPERPSLLKNVVASVMAQQQQAQANPAPTGNSVTNAAGRRVVGGVQGGAQDVNIAQTGKTRLSRWGGPESHATYALGNWQSDNAYDLGGKAGSAVYSPIEGRVTKISPPGNGPQFAGLGITVSTAGGDLFFKHLGSSPLKVGTQLRPGMLIGTLDPGTRGGPHLHLGATSRGLLERLANTLTGKK